MLYYVFGFHHLCWGKVSEGQTEQGVRGSEEERGQGK